MAKKAGNTVEANPGKVPAVVVLHGDSRFVQMQRTGELKAKLTKLHGEVDVFVFDGPNADVSMVLDELRSPNLMMTHKLVVIDNAEAMLVGSSEEEVDENGQPKPLTPEQERREANKAKNRELLEKYCKAVDSGSTLVIRAGQKLKAPKLLTAAAAVGEVVECEGLKQPEAVGFVKQRATAYGVKIEPDAAMLLVKRVGLDAGQIDCEVAKLATATFAVAKKNPAAAGVISVQLVTMMTGLSGEEAVFDFQRVLLTCMPEEALEEMRTYIQVYRHDAIVLSIFLCRLVSQIEGVARGMEAGDSKQAVAGRYKLWGGMGDMIVAAATAVPQPIAARLLKQAVETDVAMKQTGAEKERLLEVMVVRLCTVLSKARGR